jgi:hypothetical protein
MKDKSEKQVTKGRALMGERESKIGKGRVNMVDLLST